MPGQPVLSLVIFGCCQGEEIVQLSQASSTGSADSREDGGGDESDASLPADSDSDSDVVC